jgi:hypothetical protein
MFGWIVRLILVVAGTVTGFFVAKDAPNFGVIQGVVGIALIALVVFVLAYWPARWTRLIDGLRKPR